MQNKPKIKFTLEWVRELDYKRLKGSEREVERNTMKKGEMMGLGNVYWRKKKTDWGREDNKTLKCGIETWEMEGGEWLTSDWTEGIERGKIRWVQVYALNSWRKIISDERNGKLPSLKPTILLLTCFILNGCMQCFCLYLCLHLKIIFITSILIWFTSKI